MKGKSIRLPFESFLYLSQECHRQRATKPWKEEFTRHLEQRFRCVNGRNGMAIVMSGSFGGCNGSPVNAWEEGRWTNWSLEQMRKMLNEQGLPWEDGPEVEYING